MIIYDETYQIIGMEKRALEILGYDSLDEFFLYHKDIDEMIQNYDKKDKKNTFLQTILSTSSNAKKMDIKTKKGDTITATFKAQAIFLQNSKKNYKVDIIVQDIITQDKKNINANMQLRLPMLQHAHTSEATHTLKPTLIDEKWLETTRAFLHLDKDEFIGYLKIFIQNVRKSDIAIQNSAMSYNSLNIKKIITRLKEPATNLHITPLVKIYTNIQNSNTTDLSGLILATKDFINELDELLKKYQGNT